MPLIDESASMGTAQQYTPAAVLTFNMLCQATALFQSIQTLINARQPVEALPALHALVIIAARFEQMTDPAGPGLGIAARAALNSLDALGVDDADGTARRNRILRAVEPLGISVPDDLPSYKDTSIHRSLQTEKLLASQAANGSYGTIGLHTRTDGADHASFHITVEPGPFTDLTATAAVVAMLETLKHAVLLFGWTIDAAQTDELLGEALVLNESAAQLDLTMN